MFILDRHGAWSFDPDGDFDDLGPGETRTTSLTYAVSDGTDTSTATLTVTVSGVNEAPVLVDNQVGLTSPSQTLTVERYTQATTLTVPDGNGRTRTFTGNAGLLVGATDANGDTLSITRAGPSEANQRDFGASASVESFAGGNGGDRFVIFRNGTWQYQTGSAFSGLSYGEVRTATAWYTVSDGRGGTATASLTVYISPPNNAAGGGRRYGPH